MPKIEKSVNFRSFYASGVYAHPSETELRLIFVGNEPIGIDIADSPQAPQAPIISQGPHIQAEIVMGKELAEWIRKYLNEYLKLPTTTEASKQ
jgi:cell wall assembly regulator SMI1